MIEEYCEVMSSCEVNSSSDSDSCKLLWQSERINNELISQLGEELNSRTVEGELGRTENKL